MSSLSIVFAVFELFAKTERSDTLLRNTLALADVNSAEAVAAVEAALLSETDKVSAELLVSLSWAESRFKLVVYSDKSCGALQVNPQDIGRPRSDCKVWDKNLLAAFQAGVKEIEMLLADRRVHGNMALALRYRACGNSAFVSGGCRWTPTKIFARAKALQK